MPHMVPHPDMLDKLKAESAVSSETPSPAPSTASATDDHSAAATVAGGKVKTSSAKEPMELDDSSEPSVEALKENKENDGDKLTQVLETYHLLIVTSICCILVS